MQHGDAVLDALVLADQSRADDRHIVAADAPQGGIAAVQLFTQGLEALDGFGLQPAIRNFLHAISQPALQEAPIVGRRFSGK
jgi:hypothetical protein